MDRYMTRVILELDDQIAINHLVEEAGIVGKRVMPTYMSFVSAGVTFICPDPSLVSRSLESGSVIRHFQQRGETVDVIYGKLSQNDVG
jgi:hypothetical protein